MAWVTDACLCRAMADHEDDESATTRPSSETAKEELPSEDELAEIEAERKRRLAEENRPEMATVDNSGVTLPTVEKWAEDHPAEAVGTADPAQKFRENPPSEDEIAAIAEEREHRLDPANRPDGAEVDNTHRTFQDGHFVD